jgi:hypothetical protein
MTQLALPLDDLADARSDARERDCARKRRRALIRVPLGPLPPPLAPSPPAPRARPLAPLWLPPAPGFERGDTHRLA